MGIFRREPTPKKVVCKECGHDEFMPTYLLWAYHERDVKESGRLLARVDGKDRHCAYLLDMSCKKCGKANGFTFKKEDTNA